MTLINTLRLGIDIGGTKAHIGLIREDGSILDDSRIPMKKGQPPTEALPKIVALAGRLLADHGLSFSDLANIGVGVPGTVDAATGFLFNAPNLIWRDVPCGEILESLTGRRVLVMQDSRASALAEYLFGSAKGAQVLVGITLGTGIGSGIVIGGKIFSGGLGAAGESGHICVVPGGRLCGCGKRGCLEAYASGTGIALGASGIPSLKGLSSEAVFALAHQSNPDALELIAQSVAYLGTAMSAVINILSPNAMVFSGGMCAQEALFVGPLIAAIRAQAYEISAKQIQLSVSTLGNHAPLIGAAMLDKA